MSSSDFSRNDGNYQVDKDCKTEAIHLKPCPICGRTFNPQSLARHEKVCEKTKKCIKRNVFNSFSQRAKDIGAIPVLNEAKEDEKKKGKKWKEDHDGLLRVMRGTKNSCSDVMNNGLSQQKKVPTGYQQCPSCSRFFNSKAADRHIVWCMEQQTRLPKTPPSSEALERLKARVKYRAPLPKRRDNKDSNIRLVKSAESLREPLLMRTHSSPPVHVREIKPLRQPSTENCSNSNLKSCSQKKVDKSVCSNNNVCPDNNSSHALNSSTIQQLSASSSELQNKKAVKFKEIFPVYKKERNKNLDMLAALRLRLSELETSEDLSDDCFMKSNESDSNRNFSKKYNFNASASVSRDIWTSDGEIHCNTSTSSSSDGSLPSVNHAGNSEQRMPRFCYNCGTKYPIVSAKYCCECGARRFVFGANNNQIYT